LDFAAKVGNIEKLIPFYRLARSPQAAKSVFFGRSSDLLLLLAPSPCKKSGILPKHLMELTAAGTVADSHDIPY
jgi:hypothetical protein